MQTVCGDSLVHASVKVRRTIFVSGTTTPPVSEPFVLGPMDTIVHPVIPITGVFVFPVHAPAAVDAYPSSASSTHASGSVIHMEQLHTALSRVLDYYPHLSGRLHVLEDGTRVLKSLHAGAGLIEARCTETLADLKAARPVRGAPERLTLFQLPADGNALLAPYDFSSMKAVSENPVLTVQCTRFACGSVAIGIRMLHTLTDASGFFMFARHLAEVYRAITRATAACGEVDLASIQLAAPPAIDGFGARESVPVDPEALEHLPPLYRRATKPAPAQDEEKTAHTTEEPTAAATAPPHVTPVVGRELSFTARDLAALKVRAVGETNKDGWVSTFEALTALLWQRTYIARHRIWKRDVPQGASAGAPALPPCSYLTSFDVRRELQGRGLLPPHYFPNALTTPILTLTPAALLSGDLAQVATPLHELVRHSVATKGDYWMAVGRWVASLADKTSFEGDFNGGVMTSQWSRIDMYDGVSFVEGQPPALVATTFTPISLVDGLGYFLPDRQCAASPRQPGEDNGEGLTVYYALQASVWEQLEKDPAIAPHMVEEDSAKARLAPASL